MWKWVTAALCIVSVVKASTDSEICRNSARRLRPGTAGNYHPHFDTTNPLRPEVQILSSMNASLAKEKEFNDYRAAMQNGTFDYGAPELMVSGVFHEPSGVYFVSEGHHRLGAALSIAYQTGDWTCFKKLLQNGKWDTTHTLPGNRTALPHWPGKWSAERGWKAFLRPITPKNMTGLWGLFLHQ